MQDILYEKENPYEEIPYGFAISSAGPEQEEIKSAELFRMRTSQLVANHFFVFGRLKRDFLLSFQILFNVRKSGVIFKTIKFSHFLEVNAKKEYSKCERKILKRCNSETKTHKKY